MPAKKPFVKRHVDEEIEDDPFLPEEEEEEPVSKPKRPLRKAKRRESRANKSGHIVLAWNDVTIEGNLGKDPEVRATHSGAPFCYLSVAVYQGKDKDACWMQVSVWDEELVDMISEHLGVGSRVRVYGKLAQRKSNGVYYTSIVADLVEEVDR